MPAQPPPSASPARSRHQRPCPALNSFISPSDCGSQRGSKLDCPPTCTFSPWAPASYDLWLNVDATWTRKATEYVVRKLGRAEFQARVQRFTIPMEDQGLAVECAFFNALHLSLFVLAHADGRPLVELWEAEGWAGLNNDERVMTRHRRLCRPAVIEVQQVLDGQSFRCVDLVDEGARPFVVIDRGAVTYALRFARIFTWLAHYPHASRIGGIAVEIPHQVWHSWRGEVEGRWQRAAGTQPGLTLKHFLAENIVGCSTIISALREEYRRRLVESIDLHHCALTYRLNEGGTGIESVLSARPEVKPGTPNPEAGFPPPQAYYVLSAPPEPAAAAVDDPAPAGPPAAPEAIPLAQLWLYPDRLLVETFSLRNKERARRLIEDLCGAQITYVKEDVTNLATVMQEREVRQAAVERVARAVYQDGKATTSARGVAGTVPPEPSLEQLVQQAETLRQQYARFVDEPAPSLDGRTPRAAAADPAFRPRVAELLKVHLHDLDRRNREQNTAWDLNWLLDALGFPELKSTPPAT